MNLWIGTGNLGRTPELRVTESGKSVLNFSIACDRSYTTSDGRKVSETDWVPVVVWGRQAEHQARYLRKGSSVTVRGSLRPRSYVDAQGVTVRTFEVVAEAITWHSRIGTPDDGETISPAPAEI
jgi:single-strand DNA-binding protein